jgi:hypothetical protein
MILYREPINYKKEFNFILYICIIINNFNKNKLSLGIYLHILVLQLKTIKFENVSV